MSFEDTMRTIVAEQVEPLKKALQDALKAKNASGDGEDWIKVGQAARMLGCDRGHIDKLIENGFLTLAFLPGTIRGDRRLIKREVEELKQNHTVCPRTRTVK